MEDANSLGLAALGKAGGFTVEVLSRSDGRWLLSIASAAWCFDCELASPGTVGKMAAFLRSYTGRAEFAELIIGSFGGAAGRIAKDGEFEDRFFLRSSGGDSLVEFTLAGGAAEEFASVVDQAAEEFDAES